MTKERELLRRVLEAWDDEFQNIDNASIFSEIRTYLSNPSDDAEEPVAIIEEADYGCWGQILPDKSVRLGQFLYLHPPKPAEPEAEPVGYAVKMIPRGLHFIGFVGEEETEEEIEDYGPDQIVPLYTNPAQPEAETLETLKAENFKLASGQCTEGGPWGDEGGTPYCKYTNPAEPAKKPMTDFREYFEEMHSQLQEDYGDNVHIFEAGFKEGARWVQLDHSVFKHHGIGDADL